MIQPRWTDQEPLVRAAAARALLRALQSDADVNVLSTPNILTTDNQKAEILVGENVPFITGQYTTAASGGTRSTVARCRICS